MKYLWIALVVAVVVFGGYRLYDYEETQPTVLYPVVLVDGMEESKNYRVLDAYKSVLDEEGVAYVSSSLRKLMTWNPKDAAKVVMTLIFVEEATLEIPRTALSWVSEFARAGGHVLVVFNSGSHSEYGSYHPKALWSAIAGVDYFLYEELKEKTAILGTLRFPSDEAVETVQWPRGKLDDENYVVGYHYGRLDYPILAARVVADDVEVLMEGVSGTDESSYPAVTRRPLGKGGVFWTSLPLGALKGNSDDLIMRVVLRTFLFATAGVPHVVNTPNAVGGLVINWHVDSAIEWLNLPQAVKDGWLSPKLRQSVHITAGNFCDKPGDGFGFDACGAGRHLTETLMEFGEIGSHGGWAHNWYAAHLAKDALGDFSDADMERYILKNNRCLESVTDKPVREYSAPNGVHPQPMNTEILEQDGTVAYYYSGDSGSSPNRTFLDGEMITPNVIAFPVMPSQKYASLEELHRAGKDPAFVEEWMLGLLDYVEQNRVVRLWYSHPYDIPLYVDVMKDFVKSAEERQEAGTITVRAMSDYADFLQKVLRVGQGYRQNDRGGFTATFQGGEGLEEVCVAIPKKRFEVPEAQSYRVQEDELYLYLCFDGESNVVDLELVPR